MSDYAVVCTGVKKAFGATAVVDDVSFTIRPGHILALLGPSGCGKTTTLRLLAGFEELDAGAVDIGGQRVAEAPHFHLPPEKRRVGMVFQDYAIFPHLSVAQNIAFGLGRGAQAQAQTEAMLALVGLKGLGETMPHELSGGQQQRIALARALALEPAVVLLDEPFSNLDSSLRTQVREEVRALLKQSGATAVFVTHDQEEALFVGDEIGVMRAGRLEQIGAPQQVFHHPQTRFVAAFMGQADFVPGVVEHGGVETPLGRTPLATRLAMGTAVTVAVRPDDVLLQANKEGAGRVVGRRFIGIATIYRLALPDGTLVHSWQPHGVDLALGTAVDVRLDPTQRVTVFHGERAVN